jgi:Tol biopolymer transport system component
VAIKSAGYSVSFSESPDGKHIAFVSDYTGKDELWLFNTTDQTLKQLTGGDNFDSRNANFQWIDNQSLSMFLNTNTELKLFKMKI